MDPVFFWRSANQRAARVRLDFLKGLLQDYDQLDMEITNLRASLEWLAEQTDLESAELFLSYLMSLKEYLYARGQASEIEHWTWVGLEACNRLGLDAGELLYLRGRAQYALGQWGQADSSWQSALQTGEASEVLRKAYVKLSLGQLYMNQGRFGIGLKTLQQVEGIFESFGEIEAVISIHAEIAAYYLNQRNLDKALAMYLEIEERYKEMGVQPSDNILLMLGVVHRQKKLYERSIEYLDQLYRHTDALKKLSGMATAAHHMAWVYLYQGNLEQARLYCGRALAYYEDIHDPRGLSDGYEQLGAVFLEEDKPAEAIPILEHSANIRKQIGNQPGLASSLRRLAFAHLFQKQYVLALICALQSLGLYIRLRMLSRQRTLSLLRDFMVGLQQARHQ